MRSCSLALASLGVSVLITLGCDTPVEPSKERVATVTVEFGGRVVNADAGGPVGNVRVSVGGLSAGGTVWSVGPDAQKTATSGADGTFTLRLNLPSDWRKVYLEFTGPGYDDRGGHIEPTAAPCNIGPCWAVADRPAIPMYPTLVIRPGESIEVRIDGDRAIVSCGSALLGELVHCRRVVVAASPGDPVELEIVPHDSSKPMALISDQFEYRSWSVRRLILTVPPDAVPYVISDSSGTGTVTLTARR